MHKLNQSAKRRIKNNIIIGARLYQKYLVPYSFLIITEDDSFKEICFNRKDFIHLTGIRSNLSDLEFYDHCLKGTISENNFYNQQHYDFGTIRKKIIRIAKINKIIDANGDTNLILFNFHTHTKDFPLAIESDKDKMVVAFIGKDNHARSLRNNNQVLSDSRKRIIAIFSKERINNKKYERIIYLKNHENLINLSDDLISIDLFHKLNKYTSKKNIQKAYTFWIFFKILLLSKFSCLSLLYNVRLYRYLSR